MAIKVIAQRRELKNTSIQITCLDEDDNVLKRVTLAVVVATGNRVWMPVSNDEDSNNENNLH